MDRMLLSYYGDDFTGSTDVMESLALNGIPTALFLEAPTQDELDDFQLKEGLGTTSKIQKLKAFGVAGVARSWSPAKMEAELPAIFEKISRIPTDFFQYKICSTFDSAPQIGNIGVAAEIALRYFPSDFIPLVVGAPFLNRFVSFGNLFARVGHTTYRLDRHPTMSTHPITPMKESDLRLHLATQTDRTIALMDIFNLNGEYGPAADVLEKLKSETLGQFILFDTITVDHLRAVGRLLFEARSGNVQFMIGASGLDYALAFYLQEKDMIKKPIKPPEAKKAKHMIVMAGSCSPTTATQIAYMEAEGHPGIRMDSTQLIDPDKRQKVIKETIARAITSLGQNRIPIIYTAKGPSDTYLLKTRRLMRENGGLDKVQVGAILAQAQGKVLSAIIQKMGKLRVVVAGGDTSGHVLRSLGVYALETLCPIAPGAPLCIAHSKDNQFDGLELSLKGGQNGNEKFFASVLEGKHLT